jgi:hypothetical protein
MNEIPQDLLKRILRTESLAAIAGVVLFATGHVTTLEEGIVAGGGLIALILGRSVVKAKGGGG